MEADIAGLGPNVAKLIEDHGFTIEDPTGFRDQADFVLDPSSGGQGEVARSPHGSQGFEVKFGSSAPGTVYLEVDPEDGVSYQVYDKTSRSFVDSTPENSTLFGRVNSGGDINNVGSRLRLLRVVKVSRAGVDDRIFLVSGRFEGKGKTWEVSEPKVVRLGENRTS